MTHVPTVTHRPVSDERAFELARCLKDHLTAEEAAIAIMEYATDAIEQERADRTWISPIKTVADLVNNLLTLDQALAVYGAHFIDKTEDRCRARGLSLSLEHVANGRIKRDASIPPSLVIWTSIDQRLQAGLAATVEPHAALRDEQIAIAGKAREWAENYSQGSDGRNTFVLFAEWVERRAALQPEAPARGTTHAVQMRQALIEMRGAFVKAWGFEPGPENTIYRPILDRVDAALAAAPPRTPGARWREAGEPDPHGVRYDCDRAQLAGGDLTDDEVANAVFLDPGINNLTIAKDRIRWLSRRLESAGADLARIKQIIEDVDNRALAADGPVTPTFQEITDNELSRIFALASRKPEDWRP
ncbi:hypothetical protein HAP47_0022240 [Bradyrhizobium sp. 41S5]|uniref:hypothetical protein n=1 Tax=Bradyrhizobium sp. 41S5 TaxID=1404443 RepID=UPI00156B866F|nr:hypothetical protein [Bradyrhizobium sp. 41S5]UFX42014.1 hypothetical protein HAP47_0022240 [Bradyrhizobium sp. 41S5]